MDWPFRSQEGGQETEDDVCMELFKMDVVPLIVHLLQYRIQRKWPIIKKNGWMCCADTHRYCGGPSVDNGIVAVVFCVARGGWHPLLTEIKKAIQLAIKRWYTARDGHLVRETKSAHGHSISTVYVQNMTHKKAVFKKLLLSSAGDESQGNRVWISLQTWLYFGSLLQCGVDKGSTCRGKRSRMFSHGTAATWLFFQWAPTVTRADMCLFRCNGAVTSNLACLQMARVFVMFGIKSLSPTAVNLECTLLLFLVLSPPTISSLLN